MNEQLPKDVSPIFWKKEITMGQALGFIITILILVITGWMDMRISIAEHETKLNLVENNFLELKSTIKEGNLEQRLSQKELIEAINLLKLDLKDKEDRRN